MADSSNQLRKHIADRFLLNQFTRDDYEYVIQQLEQNLPSLSAQYLREKENIEKALNTGEVNREINLSLPESQLIWAAAMALISSDIKTTENWPPHNQGSKITDLKLWNELKNCPKMKSELMHFGHLVYAKSPNKNVKIRYGAPPEGYPGIGYYFDPQQNFVNIDMLWTLIIGIEHSRAAMLHEVIHSIITVKHSPRMYELEVQMMALIGKPGEEPKLDMVFDAINSGKLDKAAAKEVNELLAEWQNRHRIFDEVENNPVNRMGVNQGNLFSQDFGHSFAQIETVAIDAEGTSINAKSKEVIGKSEKQVDIESRIANTKRAVRMVFHRNNGLFEDGDWERVCVEPKLVKSKSKAQKAFDALVELTGGANGAENLIPSRMDEWKGPVHYKNRIEELATARGRVVDTIYDEYFADLFKELKKEQEKQQKQQGKGDSKSGKSKKGEGESQSRKQDNGWQSQVGESRERKEQEPGQEEQETQQKPDKFDNPGAAKAIDKHLDEISPQDIEEELTVEELEQMLKELEAENNQNQEPPSPPPILRGKPDSEDNDKDDNPKNQPLKPAPEKKKAPEIKEPVKLKEWNNYDKVREGLEWAIDSMAKKIWQIQRKSYQNSSVKPVPLTLEIREGDLALIPQRSKLAFDIRAHRVLRQKQQMGQAVTQDDYRRFQDTIPVAASNHAGGVKKVAQIDIVVLIDGSDSMYYMRDSYFGFREPTPDESVPIEAGLTSACIFHEACERRRVNSYIGLWGSDAGEIIAEPGAKTDDIKKNIASMSTTRKWNTNLAPSFGAMVEKIATSRATKWDKIGNTHFVIVSDGDLNDSYDSMMAIAKVMRHCPLTTVDFAIIANENANVMEQLAQVLKKEFPSRVGHLKIDDAKTSVNDLLELMSARVLASLEVEAIAKQQKSAMLKRGIQ